MRAGEPVDTFVLRTQGLRHKLGTTMKEEELFKRLKEAVLQENITRLDRIVIEELIRRKEEELTKLRCSLEDSHNKTNTGVLRDSYKIMHELEEFWYKESESK